MTRMSTGEGYSMDSSVFHLGWAVGPKGRLEERSIKAKVVTMAQGPSYRNSDGRENSVVDLLIILICLCLLSQPFVVNCSVN